MRAARRAGFKVYLIKCADVYCPKHGKRTPPPLDPEGLQFRVYQCRGYHFVTPKAREIMRVILDAE